MAAKIDHYAILKRPLVTEKSSARQADLNVYTFEVATDANKNKIAEAVHAIFGVEVVKVRTINCKGRRNRRNRHGYYDESNWKKALITLKEGQSIELK
jgi:large subunit ribosomal protein L23